MLSSYVPYAKLRTDSDTAMVVSASRDANACFYAAFAADDASTDIVPSFTHGPIQLLSAGKLGPFQAGIVTPVPLWLALTLHQRSLCTISLPVWLTADNIAEIIAHEKKTNELFSDHNRLPVQYYEIAKRLTAVVTDKAVPLLVQDLLSIRTDKLRQQFQQLLAASANTTDLLVAVNGIASQELALLRPLVQQALNDQSYLLQGHAAAVDTNGSGSEKGGAAASAKAVGSGDAPAVRARVPLRRFRR